MSLNLASAPTVWILIKFYETAPSTPTPSADDDRSITPHLPPPPFLHLLPYNQINNTSMTDCINISNSPGQTEVVLFE